MASRWLIQTASSGGQTASSGSTAGAIGGVLGGGSTDISHVVKSATYDATNKKLVLEKDGGDTVDVPISTLGVHESNLANQASSITTLETAGYQTASDVSTFVTGQNYVTNTVNNLTNYYDKNHSNNNFLDGISLSGKTLTIDRQAGSFDIALPIADAVEASPFAGLTWVDSNDLQMIRQSINSQMTNVPQGGFTLNDGFTISGQQTFTSQNFVMDSEDGMGILEIYFGNVSVNAGDTLFKIVTQDYKNFLNGGTALGAYTNWADMEFRMNSLNNQLEGRFNNGTNGPIRISSSGYPSVGTDFLHANTSVGNCNGGIALPYNISHVNSTFNCILAKNAVNGGIYNPHYSARGDTAFGFKSPNNTNKAIENTAGFGGISYFASWKSGSEILNGGTVSIASNDHIMIKVNSTSIEYYKNGAIVHTESNSGGSRVGGVTNFVRNLVLGNSSNNVNSTFTIRKLNWHGNYKTVSEANTIHADWACLV